ncbi:MAG: Bifunctional folate synthesis protein [bacterium]|nr:Bifunctional folate synthesis protein [bacterium]
MRYLLALGSNVGDRLEHLVAALCALSELGTLESLSGIYETDPVGYTDQGAFYNMAASLQSDLEPGDFITALNALQERLGKAVPFPNGPRTIDIDILLGEDEVWETPVLTLPHPRLHERLFVLHPLAEIAPLAIHPVLAVTVENLMGRLDVGEPAARVVTPETLWERIWGTGT